VAPPPFAYAAAVSPERPWDLESVLRLLFGVFVSLFIALLLALIISAVAKDLPDAQQKFLRSIANTLTFQCAVIALTHQFLRANGVRWGEFMGWTTPNAGRAALAGIMVAILALPFILLLNNLSGEAITQISGEPPLQPAIQILDVARSLPQQIAFALSTMVLAPLAEEILFRGVLYRTVQQLGFPRLALFGTSFVFALIHGSMMTLLPLTVLAIALCKLYDRTGRLLAPVLAHATFNAINFILFLNRDALLQWWDQLKRQLG
jgi:membrane protease YdiL (CAAX protease family)